MILFHWNEGRNVTTADRARLLCLHELFAAVLADAEVATRHYQGILGVRKANEALGVWVVVLDGLMAFLGIVVFRGHPVNRFKLEGQASDERHLLSHVHAVDVLLTVLRERAVGHHGVLGALVLIIHRDDHRVIVLNAFRQLERRQVVRIEYDLVLGNILVDAGVHRQVVNVVLAVRRVEHLRRIVWVFLFSHTHVDTDVRVAESVIIESDFELMPVGNPLYCKKSFIRKNDENIMTREKIDIIADRENVESSLERGKNGELISHILPSHYHYYRRHIFKKCTYSFDRFFIQGDLDVEVFEVIVGCGCLLASFLVNGLPPCAIHLIVLLGILLLSWSACTPRCHLHLLLLHHLHALHLLSGLSGVLLLHPSLLFTVLLGLHLLPLRSGHLLLLLVLLAAVLVVVLLLCTLSIV